MLFFDIKSILQQKLGNLYDRVYENTIHINYNCATNTAAASMWANDDNFDPYSVSIDIQYQGYYIINGVFYDPAQISEIPHVQINKCKAGIYIVVYFAEQSDAIWNLYSQNNIDFGYSFFVRDLLNELSGTLYNVSICADQMSGDYGYLLVNIPQAGNVDYNFLASQGSFYSLTSCPSYINGELCIRFDSNKLDTNTLVKYRLKAELMQWTGQFGVNLNPYAGDYIFVPTTTGNIILITALSMDKLYTGPVDAELNEFYDIHTSNQTLVYERNSSYIVVTTLYQDSDEAVPFKYLIENMKSVKNYTPNAPLLEKCYWSWTSAWGDNLEINCFPEADTDVELWDFSERFCEIYTPDKFTVNTDTNVFGKLAFTAIRR